MKAGGAVLLIIVGLLALWIVVTGRLAQVQAAWQTLQTGTPPVAGGGVTKTPASLTMPTPLAVPHFAHGTV